MKIQLMVIKSDGTVEEYLHTKIIGTINNALTRIDQADICIAEQLAEAVTYFLYHRQNRRSVASGEILSVIEAVLTTTGYEEAAIALSEHHLERRLRRCRIEVISADISGLTDAEIFAGQKLSGQRSCWDKSRIVAGLVAKYNMDSQTARTIASMVEEKILNMGVTLVSTGLVRQLVLGDAAAMLQAQRQLQTV
jgi:transcriptional regulator NrdR family protein